MNKATVTQRQWTLSDMFGGILFAAILLSMYFTCVRVSSGLGFAGVFVVLAWLLLTVIVSIAFALRMRSILVCLLAVTTLWISIFVYDVIHAELPAGIWEHSKGVSIPLAIHLLLQYAVGKAAQISRKAAE